MAEVANAPVDTVDINDAIFCSAHLKEVVSALYVSHDPYMIMLRFEFMDREPIESPVVTQNKDGVYQCKKHGSQGCNQCFGWKKQITRSRTAAKKAGKK
ncbi:hypothetical protein H0H87_010413 [Tephrocybe sp. NHM501043]|nr:hypothetical protein H0H87_010413 [Tephrocybe sp. NHM501043]